MKKSLMPYVARTISSDALLKAKRSLFNLRAKLSGQAYVINIFIKPDDPYSYLLLQALPSIQARFSIAMRFHVINDLDEQMYPRLDMLRAYATYDAHQLAQLYSLDFPEEVPHVNQTDTETLSYYLVALKNDESFITQARHLLEQFWFNGNVPEKILEGISERQNKLSNNFELLSKTGHYQGAMISFDGEWYWAIDRLDHLEERLLQMGLAKQPDEKIYFDKTYKNFCKTQFNNSETTEPNTPLTLFWSARSPYSYIAIEKAVTMAQHYHLPLEIKPVMPMMMRGMNVPHTKKMYIFLDTKREARKLGIPYGFVADPLGKAVERCYALIDYADSKNLLNAFLLSFARGVNAQGIRAETDKGMKEIVTRCGLDWSIAKMKLNNDQWKLRVQKNLDEMFAMGCWGVPCIRYEDQHYWGQDRFAMLENHILRNK
ncbi:DsbA family protein [Agarilytica rhodophyticola]|uniref:DsbA family protein n=1 Tax=Agarilytica rhodophyticola TaxID=1737490 RepID=UPI0013152BEE|nr:DsbA family protein [Agarilytica rhodophyticola]